MEYVSTSPDKSVLRLPKCGAERNVLECYSVTEKQLADEQRCINTLLSSEGYLDQLKKYGPDKNNDMLESKKAAIQNLLLSHPFPRNQGPFDKPMSELKYENILGAVQEDEKFTFNSFTTFQHEHDQPCKLWSINSKQVPSEPKHVLTFTTKDTINDINLCGPASDLNMCIMYNCNKQKCVIMCPCTVCQVKDSCKIQCAADPCMECSVQCVIHNVGLPRKFDRKVDSFTIPCSSKQLIPTQEDTKCEFDVSHKYAGIPRSCLQCRLDLLDHQIHHHVLHYGCKFCKEVLRFLNVEFITEIDEVKKDIQRTNDLTCSFCYKIFTTHANRLNHERTEHGYVQMSDLYGPGKLYVHGGMYNQSEKLLNCSICKCSCDDTIQLKKHKMNEHGIENEEIKKPYGCNSCDRSYASSTALKYHEMRNHNVDTRKHLCEVCNKEFSSESTLVRHINSIHQDARYMLECSLCDQKFKRKDHLTRHKKEIHKVAYINTHYSNSSSSNLTINTIKPYKCTECGIKFKRKELLKIHTRTVHKLAINSADKGRDQVINTVKSSNQDVQETNSSKVYKCDSCDKVYQHQSDLNRHRRSKHTAGNSMKCEYCGKPFNRKDSMLRHMNTCKLNV